MPRRIDLSVIEMFSYYVEKKTKGARFTETKRDLQEMEITCDNISLRDLLRMKLKARR